MNQNKKTIVIAGPTASGKSDLAIALAKKYSGEIISADSRQVYRGMNIGTGKVARDFPVISNTQFLISNKEKEEFFSEGIRHHLIDIADPKEDYNVAHFVRDAEKAIADIRKRGKTPIICGGTHFWIEALLSGHPLPAVKPDPALREELGKRSAEELFTMLEKKDPVRAASIDKHNKIRLIRALEICAALGKVPSLCHSRAGGNPGSSFWIPGQARDDKTNAIIIAFVPPKEILHERIAKRLEKRIAEGMIEEVERLHTEGVSWERLESFGLEYRYVALFLQKKISHKEMLAELEMEIRRYAKRQLTFLRRMERSGLTIHWISSPEEASQIIT
jgi:tRNA dimethylallyltransferase